MSTSVERNLRAEALAWCFGTAVNEAGAGLPPDPNHLVKLSAAERLCIEDRTGKECPAELSAGRLRQILGDDNSVRFAP